ncbi:MAG: hypothetical protein RBS73_13270 [Prolixibacteraceae bacterium]|jgi:uncharacterized protein (TIGR02646 family)|nr:hypothetical protein [Prolixibacteraceae bacterium]
MIRIRKSELVPQSLSAPDCSRYDGHDVQQQLYADQDGKCYLCEQQTGKDYQIEHFKPKAEGFFPELEFDWRNLFLSCPYCNGRKPNSFTNLLNPTSNNNEEIIEQRISFGTSKINLKSEVDTAEVNQTIQLLDKLLNGTPGVRDERTQILYEDIKQEITFFMELLAEYKKSRNETIKDAIIASLDIRKEFLGLKYWIIKDASGLYVEFSPYLIWNKQ